MNKLSQLINYDLIDPNNSPLILDGAMGSILQAMHPQLYQKNLWMNKCLLLTQQDLINIYYDYLVNGASVLTSYTFTTGGMAIMNCQTEDQSYTSTNLVKCAFEICRKAIQKYRDDCTDDYHKHRKIVVAGSNSPVTYCYGKTDLDDYSDHEIMERHTTHIKLLIDNGCDIVLNETFGNLREIRILVQICKKLEIIDRTIISLFCEDDGKLLGGEDISEAIKECINNDIMVGLNCITSKTIHKVVSNNLDLFRSKLANRWVVYPNYGQEDYLENFRAGRKFDDGQQSAGYGSLTQLVSYLYQQQVVPSMIGLCCNSVPKDIADLKRLVDQQHQNYQSNKPI